MKKEELLNKIISIPDNYQLVEEKNEIRNKKEVTILRFQQDGKFVMNGPRIIAVFEKDALISIKDLTSLPEGKLPSTERAIDLAEKIFLKSNRPFAKGLSYMRVEHQKCEFVDEIGKKHPFPVLWIKFGHTNGSYNWVTLAGNSQLIEMEFDSRWDYFRGRRKTEMWDNDDWVIAREGKGPQLKSPNALA